MIRNKKAKWCRGAGMQGRRNEGVKECRSAGVQKCRSEGLKGVNK